MTETLEVPKKNVETKGHTLSTYRSPNGALTYHKMTGSPDYYGPVNVFPCRNCDEHLMFNLDSEKLTCEVTTDCPYPNPTEYTTSIKVESGSLTFSDHLFINFETPDSPSINSYLGQRKFSEMSAESGMIAGCIGNTSPGVFYSESDNRILVANFFDDDEEEEIPSGFYRINEYTIAPEGYKPIGNICTDIWMYQFMDSSVYNAKPDSNKVDRTGHAFQTLFNFEVPNGDWEFTHHSSQPNFDDDYDDHVIYAEAVLKR